MEYLIGLYRSMVLGFTLYRLSLVARFKSFREGLNNSYN